MYIIERYDTEEKHTAFYTENDEYSCRADAAEYLTKEDAEEVLANDPWQDTGDYYYKIKKIN